jgi:hypothetical protein
MLLDCLKQAEVGQRMLLAWVSFLALPTQNGEPKSGEPPFFGNNPMQGQLVTSLTALDGPSEGLRVASEGFSMGPWERTTHADTRGQTSRTYLASRDG